MPKEEWGVKRLCPHCNSRFYDLNRDPMTCPECGQIFTAESLTAGRGRVLVSDKTAARGQVDDDNDLTEDDLDDDAADVDLDDDLLEEDEDDNVSLDDIADVAGSDDEA
ncbi:TIGR02300 family protein [Paracoccus sp. p4-l81]|uniref:TIGR02300 family protein n=1 Tax=unclassified Paracoccus (in: a-proteobacteria) TaxID=2688777 RepID=UPI0035B9E5C5